MSVDVKVKMMIVKNGEPNWTSEFWCNRLKELINELKEYEHKPDIEVKYDKCIGNNELAMSYNYIWLNYSSITELLNKCKEDLDITKKHLDEQIAILRTYIQSPYFKTEEQYDTLREERLEAENYVKEEEDKYKNIVYLANMFEHEIYDVADHYTLDNCYMLLEIG